MTWHHRGYYYTGKHGVVDPNNWCNQTDFFSDKSFQTILKDFSTVNNKRYLIRFCLIQGIYFFSAICFILTICHFLHISKVQEQCLPLHFLTDAFCNAKSLQVHFKRKHLKHGIQNKWHMCHTAHQTSESYVYSFKQTWISFTHGLFVPSLVDTGPVVLETIFKYRAVFFYFVIISPWKRVWPIIWTNLNPLQPRWSTSVFPLFSYYIPFEGDITLHLCKIKLVLCV